MANPPSQPNANPPTQTTPTPAAQAIASVPIRVLYPPATIMVIARITIPLPTTSIPTTRELRDILVIEPAKATLATLHAALTRLFLDNPRYHDARYVDTSHAAYLAVQVRRDTLALQALVASWMQYPPRIRVYEGNVRGVLWALDRKGPRGCLVVDFGLV